MMVEEARKRRRNDRIPMESGLRETISILVQLTIVPRTGLSEGGTSMPSQLVQCKSSFRSITLASISYLTSSPEGFCLLHIDICRGCMYMSREGVNRVSKGSGGLRKKGRVCGKFDYNRSRRSRLILLMMEGIKIPFRGH